MKKLFQSLLAFLETKSGLVILGFLATTVCGTLLNNQIQTRQSENEHSFEIYKMRLSEAKNLQAQLLKNSSARSFYLQQVMTRLEHTEEYQAGEILKYWNDRVAPTKDSWNKDINYQHAQARVLFTPALADMLLVNKENQPITHDEVLEKLDEETFKKTLPRSLHGAFVDAHATLFFLLHKCVKPGDCDRDHLKKLAEEQNITLEGMCNAG
jgi:hypothetical protein